VVPAAEARQVGLVVVIPAAYVVNVGSSEGAPLRVVHSGAAVPVAIEDAGSPLGPVVGESGSAVAVGPRPAGLGHGGLASFVPRSGHSCQLRERGRNGRNGGT
jgi:hypothetical protein